MKRKYSGSKAFKSGLILLPAISSVAFTHFANASNATWSYGGVDNKWSTAGNWNTGTKPSSSGTAFFDASSQMSISTTGTNQIGVIDFQAGAGNYVFANGALQIANSGQILIDSGVTAATETFNTPTITLLGGATFANNSSSSTALSITGSVAGSGGLTLSGTGGGTNQISGAISGSAVSILSTGGTWDLSGANTYSAAGGTVISAGTLIAGISNATTISGAFGPSANHVTLGNAATTTGNTSPTLLNAGFTVSNPITVANQSTTGAYTIGGSNTSGTATFTGSITLNQPVKLTAASGGTTDFNTGTWTTNNQAITIGSTGNNGIVQIDQTLATTGGIAVSDGTFILNSAMTSGNISVAAGATLAGTGSVSGTTTITGTHHQSTNAAAATPLTLTALAMQGSSAINLLSTSSLVLNDNSKPAFNVSGTLNLLSSGSGAISINDTSSLADGSYDLFNYGNLQVAGATPGSSDLTSDFSFVAPVGKTISVQAASGSVDLVVSNVVVPEPATSGLLAFTATGLLLRRRRRGVVASNARCA